MENTTLIVIGFMVSSLGVGTIIGFIAKIWHKTETHEKEIQRLERKVEEVEHKEIKDFDELKKKNETMAIAITKLENLPNDVNEIKNDIKGILQLIRK